MTPLAAAAADAAGTGTAPIGAIEVVFVLLLVATALAVLARRIGLPYPMLLVPGGLLLAFVPGLPRIELEPDLVFLLFLPPILFAGGYFTSVRDFKANLRPIGLLAVGLVLFTTVVVAVVARLLIGLDWPVAFALGAIVAPPDAVAATAVFQRLGVPRRIVTILEGESLINDAVALVAYRFALAAAAFGTFSLAQAGVTFVAVSAGGVVAGLVVGWLVSRAVERTNDPIFSVVITFLAPVAAYLPAERLGLSGVLATVVAGIYLGRNPPRSLGSDVRVAGQSAWSLLLFLINGAVFVLIGLQLPTALEGLGERSPVFLLGTAVGICLAVIVARIVWVFAAAWLLPGFRASSRGVAVVSWAGMRGVVSLAAALALPADFPERHLLIFLTFAVIIATLVGQGLSLPLVIRRLGVVPDAGGGHEEAHARLYLYEAAVELIGRLGTQWPTHQPLIEALDTHYRYKVQRLGDLHREDDEAPQSEAEQEAIEHRQIRQSVVDAMREALLRLHETGAVSDEVFRRVERDLDLEELRMEA